MRASGIGPGTWVLGPRFWILGSGSWVPEPGSWVLDHRTRIQVPVHRLTHSPNQHSLPFARSTGW